MLRRSLFSLALAPLLGWIPDTPAPGPVTKGELKSRLERVREYLANPSPFSYCYTVPSDSYGGTFKPGTRVFHETRYVRADDRDAVLADLDAVLKALEEQ